MRKVRYKRENNVDMHAPNKVYGLMMVKEDNKVTVIKSKKKRDVDSGGEAWCMIEEGRWSVGWLVNWLVGGEGESSW